eukprot:6071292-Heterocapsa_arctica.AAC.1
MKIKIRIIQARKSGEMHSSECLKITRTKFFSQQGGGRVQKKEEPTHSEHCEIDTQEYDQFIENHQETQVGDDVKDALGEQENNLAEDDIYTQAY